MKPPWFVHLVKFTLNLSMFSRDKYEILPSTIFVSLPNIVAFFASTNYVCDIQIYYSSIFMMKIYNKLFKALLSSNEGLTIVKSALKLFTVVKLRYQLN